jgi:ribosomal protein L7/L12
MKRCINIGGGIKVQTDGHLSMATIKEIRKMGRLIVDRLVERQGEDMSGKQAYWKLDRLERYFVVQAEMIKSIKALRERKNLGLREAADLVRQARLYAERHPYTGYELKP